MMKYEVFLGGALLCGSLQCAMTPAGRALAPQAQPGNQAAHNPVMLNALLDYGKHKGVKVNYVHDAQPKSIDITRSKSENLNALAEQAYQKRMCAIKILSEKIYERKDNTIDSGPQAAWYLTFGFDYAPVRAALRAFGLETYGCTINEAVTQLNQVSKHIESMQADFGGANTSVVIDEVRQQNSLVDGWFKVLHDNMGMLSLRNGHKVTGSTLDSMAYPLSSLYPELSKNFRSQLVLMDEQEAQKKWPIGAETPERRMHSLVLNAIVNSKHSMQELSAVGHSHAFAQASNRDFTLIQRLIDYKLRVLYADVQEPSIAKAIHMLNGLFNPKHTMGMKDHTTDIDKYSFIDEIRSDRTLYNKMCVAIENGMRGVSLIGDRKNLMGSTIDEFMYKTNLYSELDPLWRSYFVHKDRQRYQEYYPNWDDKKLDYDILLGALSRSFSIGKLYHSTQELIALENSEAYKNYQKSVVKMYGHESQPLKNMIKSYKKQIEAQQ